MIVAISAAGEARRDHEDAREEPLCYRARLLMENATA
jgi:hypothetical protein